jgi:hypothetical protein
VFGHAADTHITKVHLYCKHFGLNSNKTALMSFVPVSCYEIHFTKYTSQIIIHLTAFNSKISVIKDVVKYTTNIRADFVSLELISGKGKCIAVTCHGRHRGGVEI